MGESLVGGGALADLRLIPASRAREQVVLAMLTKPLRYATSREEVEGHFEGEFSKK